MIVAVVGKGRNAPAKLVGLSIRVGRMVATAGHVTLTGGLGGVMAGAAMGAQEIGGLTVGILPENEDPHPFNTVIIRSGMSHASRNVILAKTADAMIALTGSHGTLQEIAVAIDRGIPLAQVETDTWDHLGLSRLTEEMVPDWLTCLTSGLTKAGRKDDDDRSLTEWRLRLGDS